MEEKAIPNRFYTSGGEANVFSLIYMMFYSKNIQGPAHKQNNTQTLQRAAAVQRVQTTVSSQPKLPGHQHRDPRRAELPEPALNQLPRGESAACGQSRGAAQANQQQTVRYSHMQSVPNGLCCRGQHWKYWHGPPAVPANLRSRQIFGKWPYKAHAKDLWTLPNVWNQTEVWKTQSYRERAVMISSGMSRVWPKSLYNLCDWKAHTSFLLLNTSPLTRYPDFPCIPWLPCKGPGAKHQVIP